MQNAVTQQRHDAAPDIGGSSRL